jgi:hypothetical protein
MRWIGLAIVMALSLTACAGQNAYRAATEQERASIITAVRDYYTLRDRLMTGLAIEDFWRTYPDLSYEHDLGRGITADQRRDLRRADPAPLRRHLDRGAHRPADDGRAPTDRSADPLAVG